MSAEDRQDRVALITLMLWLERKVPKHARMHAYFAINTAIGLSAAQDVSAEDAVMPCRIALVLLHRWITNQPLTEAHELAVAAAVAGWSDAPPAVQNAVVAIRRAHAEQYGDA
jgi:hypothetical protein